MHSEQNIAYLWYVLAIIALIIGIILCASGSKSDDQATQSDRWNVERGKWILLAGVVLAVLGVVQQQYDFRHNMKHGLMKLGMAAVAGK